MYIYTDIYICIYMYMYVCIYICKRMYVYTTQSFGCMLQSSTEYTHVNARLGFTIYVYVRNRISV